MNTIITFHEDGTCTALKTEVIPWSKLGAVTVRRASHILPAHPLKRLAFRFVRFIFSDTEWPAVWARHWRGPWQVRFAASPNRVAFAHLSRRVCIDWEIQQLNGKV